MLELTRQYHRLIDDFLILHQEALIEQRLSLAMDIWTFFSRLLDQHIEVENQHMLPLAEPLADSLRWPASLYLHEHSKIRDLMAKNRGRLEALAKAPLSARRRMIIEVIDYQRSFKNVVEHHEEREEIALLPELAELLGDEQLAALLAGLQQGWMSLAEVQATHTRFSEQLDAPRQQDTNA